jgi:hypothetical protein
MDSELRLLVIQSKHSLCVLLLLLLLLPHPLAG